MADELGPHEQRYTAVLKAIGRCGLRTKEKSLLWVLCINADMPTNICAIDTQRMAIESGLGRSSVFTALKELKANGFLLTVKRQHLQPTQYLINTHLILRLANEPKDDPSGED